MSLRMQAEYFYNAYELLTENYEAFCENFESSRSKECRQTAGGIILYGRRPTPGVEIVCLAFSLELHLKDLHNAANGVVPRGHNILKLFERLPVKLKREVFSHPTISENPFFTRGNLLSIDRFSKQFTAYDGFIDEIKTISSGFEKWRYSYENAVLKYNTGFALAFIESLVMTTDKLRRNTISGSSAAAH